MYAHHRDRVHEVWRNYSSAPRKVVWMAQRRQGEEDSCKIKLQELPKELKRPRLFPLVMDEEEVCVQLV